MQTVLPLTLPDKQANDKPRSRSTHFTTPYHRCWYPADWAGGAGCLLIGRTPTAYLLVFPAFLLYSFVILSTILPVIFTTFSTFSSVVIRQIFFLLFTEVFPLLLSILLAPSTPTYTTFQTGNMKNLRAIAKCTSNEFLIRALKCSETTSFISTDSWRRKTLAVDTVSFIKTITLSTALLARCPCPCP